MDNNAGIMSIHSIPAIKPATKYNVILTIQHCMFMKHFFSMVFISIWQYHILHLFLWLISPLLKCKLLRLEAFLILLSIVSTLLGSWLSSRYWMNGHNPCIIVRPWKVEIALQMYEFEFLPRIWLQIQFQQSNEFSSWSPATEMALPEFRFVQSHANGFGPL